jgi:hypothetical protein
MVLPRGGTAKGSGKVAVPSDAHVSEDPLESKADSRVTFLDPCDIQRKLKLSSRRAARDLIVREMEHIVVARTPMTTPAWLTDWLERQRRSPRRPSERPDGQDVAITARRSRPMRRGGPVLPPPRRRTKNA